MKEKWIDIKGYEGFYQVSSLGGIKRLARSSKRRSRWGGWQSYPITMKILKGQPDKDGYLRVALRKESKQTHYLISRLVAAAFIPNPNNLPQVNHKNLDKADNKASNLEWATSQKNIQHAWLNGVCVYPKGSKHGMAILHESNIPTIKKRLAAGEFQRVVAKDYQVHPVTICDINTGRTWSHVK